MPVWLGNTQGPLVLSRPRGAYTLYPTGGNDTTAIQAAVTALGTGGGTVSFTPGTYSITGTIKLPASNTATLNLVGYGARIVLNGASGFLEFNDTADYQSFRYFDVRGFELDASGRSATAGFYFIGAYNAFGNFYPKRGNVEYIDLRDLNIHGAPSLGVSGTACAIALGCKQGALRGQTAADGVTENTTNYVRHITVDNVTISGGDTGVLVCTELSAAVANVAPIPSDCAMVQDDITISRVWFDSLQRPPYSTTRMNTGIQVGVWGRGGTCTISDCYLRGSYDNLLEIDNMQVANVSNVQCIENRNHAFTLTRFGYPLDATSGVNEGSMTVHYTDCYYDKGDTGVGYGWGYDYDEVLNHVAHPTYHVTYTNCYTINADDSVTYYTADPLPGAPSITGLSVTHASIGAQVTITGSGFGSAQGTSEVWFGEYANPVGIRPSTREAATYVSWSDTAIVVTVPSMSPGHVDYPGTYHPVYVQIGATASNRASFYIDPVNVVDATHAAGTILPNSTRTVETTNYPVTVTRDGNVSFTTTSTYSADSGSYPAYGNIVKGHDILFKDCRFVATNSSIDGSDSGVVTLGSFAGAFGGQQETYNLTFVNCVIENNTGLGGDSDGVNGVKSYHNVAGRWGDYTFSDCSFGAPPTNSGTFTRAAIELVEPTTGLSGGANATNNIFQNLHITGCNFETVGWIAVSLATYCRTPDFSRDILIEDCTFKGNAGTTYWGSSQLEFSGYGLEVRDCDFWQWRGSVFSLEGNATDIGGLSMAGHDCLRYFKNLTVDMTHTYASPAPTSGADIFTVDHQEGAVWDNCDFNTGNASRHIRWATYFNGAGSGFDTCVNEDFSTSYIHGHCEGSVPTQAYNYWACWNLNNPEVQYANNIVAWPTLGTRP